MQIDGPVPDEELTPRLFALTRDDAGERQLVVGYGMVLPDGSAYAVTWPPQPGGSCYSTDNAEDCAAIRDADLMWLPKGPR